MCIYVYILYSWLYHKVQDVNILEGKEVIVNIAFKISEQYALDEERKMRQKDHVK